MKLSPRGMFALTLGRFHADERRILAMLLVHGGRLDWSAFHDVLEANPRHPRLYRALASLKGDRVIEEEEAGSKSYRLAEPTQWRNRLDDTAKLLLSRSDKLRMWAGRQVEQAPEGEKPRMASRAALAHARNGINPETNSHEEISAVKSDSIPDEINGSCNKTPEYGDKNSRTGAPTRGGMAFADVVRAMEVVFDTGSAMALDRMKPELAKEFRGKVDVLACGLWAAMIDKGKRPFDPARAVVNRARGMLEKGVPSAFRNQPLPRWRPHGVSAYEVDRPAPVSFVDVEPTGRDWDRAIKGDKLAESRAKYGRVLGVAPKGGRS